MQIHYSIAGQDPATHSKLNLNVGIKSKINILILVHLFLFILYSSFESNEITSLLTIPSETQFRGWANIFTYHFVHLSISEFLLSMSMLWLFGNMLQEKLGHRKVIFLYFLSVTLSGIVFNVSHLLFPVFSGGKAILDGAFGGVLTIMTIALFFFKSYKLTIGKKVHFAFWQIYLLVLLLSFSMFYKHNLASVMIYACSIYIGFKIMIQEKDELDINSVALNSPEKS